jgi:hypothetical protein
MPNYEMRMGFNSKDSDTTFKEKDQVNINSGPGGRRAASNLYRKKAYAKARSSSTRSYGFDKSKGSIRGQQRKAELIRQGRITPNPVVTSTPSVPKVPSVTVKPKAPVVTPKKPTKTVKPAAKSIVVPKPQSISITAPKPTASTSIPTPKPTATVSAPKTKSSKIRAKGEAALASGNVKKAQRLRKRYDRVTKRENKKAAKSTGSIADAYKVEF